ncbi:peptidoglycan-binding protein [Actinoplanes friuliensis]|uniref:Peptidoglycan-binding domain 1 protein n=1 Tax=Actinoplanes friuliensis DSM 7358 TaxID=1246995 RepID=U5W0Z6_9ACTN|nr:peptidoglycan-binding domain-containing protein [Actinoplanes friuliensis]AGZ41625.1 peptidoglycan-binding domain 1 protein [Actinoplanes friuliensis DSM 7358]
MFGFAWDRPDGEQILEEPAAAPAPAPREDGPVRRNGRRRWALLMAGGATLLSLGGLIGASFVQSPEQQRASALPPAPSVLTATVEERLLASTVVTRGEVGADRQVEVTPASAQGAEVTVVTAVRTRVGAKIKPGDVVLTVSGRPLMILPGAIPAYRDLKPGDEGDDIAQLQSALRRLGHYDSGDRRGWFGPSTKAAVRRLYADIGYEVPDTGGPGGQEDREPLRAADDAVGAARSAVTSLKARLAAATPPPSAPGEPTLKDQLKAAKRTLARAEQDRRDLVARTGPMVPLAEAAFLTTFPATVVAVGRKVGDPVEAPLITFATGRLTVTAKLQPEQASLLRPGMPVEILSETLREKATGVVGTVGKLTTDRSGGDGEEGQAAGLPYVPVTVTTKKALGNQWNNLDVRLTVTAAQTSGKVLVVPVSAVSASADGTTTVSVSRPSGDLVRVSVEPGVSGDGFIAVTPAADATLAAGDRVVVGR